MSCSKEKSIYTKTGQQPWKSHFTAPQTDHWFWEVKYFKYYCIIGLIYILYLCVTLTYNLHYMDPFILICFNIDDSLRNLWFVESVHSPLTSLLQSSNLKKGSTIEFVTLCLKNFTNTWKLLSVEDNIWPMYINVQSPNLIVRALSRPCTNEIRLYFIACTKQLEHCSNSKPKMNYSSYHMQ